MRRLKTVQSEKIKLVQKVLTTYTLDIHICRYEQDVGLDVVRERGEVEGVVLK